MGGRVLGYSANPLVPCRAGHYSRPARPVVVRGRGAHSGPSRRHAVRMSARQSPNWVLNAPKRRIAWLTDRVQHFGPSEPRRSRG